jgi:predicted PurR-regulated permease PerM
MSAARESFRRARRRRPRSPAALIVLATLALGALLYFAQRVFIPIALALLFALILSSAVEALHRRHIPRIVSAVLLLGILLGMVGMTLNLVWEPAQQWLAAAPRTLHSIERKVRPVQVIVRQVESMAHRVGNLGSPSQISSEVAPLGGPPPAPTEMVAATGSMILSTVSVVLLTLFLLAGGPPMLARMTASLQVDLNAVHVLRVIEAVRSEIGRYYGTIALINMGLGAVTAAIMALLGLPNPVLWGAMAGVLNFIPYAGSVTTLVVLTSVAFVSFDGLGHVIAVSGSYLALATFEGQTVQPLLLGQRLELNPIIVFLALWLGGWFWGVAGVALSIPVLVAVKVVAKHSEHGQALLEVLCSTQRVQPKLLGQRATVTGLLRTFVAREASRG